MERLIPRVIISISLQYLLWGYGLGFPASMERLRGTASIEHKITTFSQTLVRSTTFSSGT
jgi:hypothetical protein